MDELYSKTAMGFIVFLALTTLWEIETKAGADLFAHIMSGLFRTPVHHAGVDYETANMSSAKSIPYSYGKSKSPVFISKAPKSSATPTIDGSWRHQAHVSAAEGDSTDAYASEDEPQSTCSRCETDGITGTQ